MPIHNDRTQVWSSGGGVQSSAIAALICQGKLRPDHGVIIDTEREMSTTWIYLDQWVMPALRDVGVELHRVRKSKYATVDLWGGKNKDHLLIPAFTDFNGEGKLPTRCSNEWKQRVMRRYVTRDLGLSGPFDIWIGYTIDELKRIRQPIGKWQNRYPLIERRMTRADCVQLIREMGWPEAPRSRCYMCPNQTSDEWLDMKLNHPRDWSRARHFERYIRTIDDTVYLADAGRVLDECDFEREDDLFTGRCDSGMCFV
jgi:hypothetical protein